MYKAKQTLSAVLIAMSMSVQAQTRATELVNNNPLINLERGISIDLYGDYTLVGTSIAKEGTTAKRGGLLFYQNQFIRQYSASNTYDGAGRPKTVAIDQHALVIAAPGFIQGASTVGKISVFNKTWNGTHYSPTESQSFTETVAGTGFGEAVSISDNWIVVGAPYRNIEGGVKLFFRNPGNGVWEDKGWLTLPNFDLAPFRFSEYGTRWNAGFGASLHIHHNNLIVGAPGIGSFYIYEFNGTNWVNVSENKGTDRVGDIVAISDEYAVATGSGLQSDVLKKSWGGTNPWPKLQTITTETPISGVATEGNKLVAGQRSAPNGGKVEYYEVRSHAIPGTNTWVNDFVKIGKMNVTVAGSPNGLYKVALLGTSVAIYQNTVVAGAPNAQYSPTGYADGAAFKGNFSQYVAAREDNAEETPETVSASYLFPNPASDVVNVSSTSEILSAHAFSTVGLKYSLPVVGNQVITSGLATGMYAITVSTKEGETTQNILIK